MKNIFLILFAMASISSFAQVAIGKSSITKLADNVTPNPSISLEFGDANRGLLLPWVSGTSNATPFITGSPNDAVNGTLVFDASDKKVKVKYASGWKDLSINTTGTTVDPLTNVDGMSIQTPLQELPTAKVSIGTPSTTPGILILEDTNKAMILPKVASPHLNIINPAPGIVAYDTVKKQVAVFNGKVWTFWKPQD
jgi:hypothetical protein